MKTRITVLAAALLFGSSTARATDRVEVSVDAPFAPTTAIGLLVSSKGTIEKVAPELKPSGQGRFSVSFPVADSEVYEDTVATAVVFSPDGDLAFGDVKVMGASQSSAPLPPPCREADVTPLQVSGHSGVLASLVEIRRARREVAKSKVQTYLSDESLDRFRALEKGLGLGQGEPLGPDMDPYVLVDRLSRLLAAVKSYQAVKRGGAVKSEE